MPLVQNEMGEWVWDDGPNGVPDGKEGNDMPPTGFDDSYFDTWQNYDMSGGTWTPPSGFDPGFFDTWQDGGLGPGMGDDPWGPGMSGPDGPGSVPGFTMNPDGTFSYDGDGGFWNWMKNNFKWDNGSPSKSAITSGSQAQNAALGRIAEGNLALEKGALDLARNKFLSDLPTRRARQAMLGDFLAKGAPAPMTHPRANVVNFTNPMQSLSEGSKQMGQGLASSAQTAQKTQPDPVGPVNLPGPDFWETANSTMANLYGTGSSIWDFLQSMGIGR